MPTPQPLRSLDRLKAWTRTAAVLLAACGAEPAERFDPGSVAPPCELLVQTKQNGQAPRPDSNLLTDPAVPADLRRLVERLAALYSPEAELHERPLSFVVASSGGSGAWAEATPTQWQVQISRDFLAERLPNDLISAILCHELGHLVGGFPFRNEPGRPLPHGMPDANEGQADYFASKDCLPRLWASEPRQNAMFRRRVRRGVRQQCDSVWKDVEAQNLCYRSAETSEAFGAWLAARDVGRPKPPDVLTPDRRILAQTWPTHPAPQCRTDTLFQGALCPKRIVPGVIPGFVSDRVSVDAEELAADYACTSGVGARPACWFAPNEPSHEDSFDDQR